MAPVSFLDPDPDEIRIGATRLRDHLKAAGVRDALVVREVLRGLDFSAFEARYRSGGRPAFAPASLTGIVLYGLMHGVSSLRDMERFARTDLGCMWVSGGNMPDHSVLGRFINRHEVELSALLFEQVVQAVLAKTGSSTRSVAGDGTVIEAMSSRYGILRREAAAERLAGLPADVPAERARLETMLETLDARRAANGGRGHTALNPQEPDAAVLRLKGSQTTRAGYVPAVLANEARVVIDAAVGSSHELAPMQSLLERQADAVEEVLLDAGFRAEPVLELAVERDINVLIPATGGEEGTRGRSKYFPQSAFRYDAEADVYHCPAGQVLKRQARYRRQHRARYTSRACFTCPLHDQCTKQKRRMIERTRATELREGLAEVMAQPQARQRYHKRKGMVEPVFSHLRGQQGLNRFRRRGLAKVGLEFRLHIMAYNLARAVVAVCSSFISACERAIGALRAIWRHRDRIFDVIGLVGPAHLINRAGVV
jgi:transposase